MGKRTVVTCDRCEDEIKFPEYIFNLHNGFTAWLLCETCKKLFNKFMKGK